MNALKRLFRPTKVKTLIVVWVLVAVAFAMPSWGRAGFLSKAFFWGSCLYAVRAMWVAQFIRFEEEPEEDDHQDG